MTIVNTCQLVFNMWHSRQRNWQLQQTTRLRKNQDCNAKRWHFWRALSRNTYTRCCDGISETETEEEQDWPHAMLSVAGRTQTQVQSSFRTRWMLHSHGRHVLVSEIQCILWLRESVTERSYSLKIHKWIFIDYLDRPWMWRTSVVFWQLPFACKRPTAKKYPRHEWRCHPKWTKSINIKTIWLQY